MTECSCSFCGQSSKVVGLDGLEFTDRQGWLTQVTEVVSEILPEVTDATGICEECLQIIVNFYQLKRDISLGINKAENLLEQDAGNVKEEFEEFTVSSIVKEESVISPGLEDCTSEYIPIPETQFPGIEDDDPLEKTELIFVKPENEEGLLIETEEPQTLKKVSRNVEYDSDSSSTSSESESESNSEDPEFQCNLGVSDESDDEPAPRAKRNCSNIISSDDESEDEVAPKVKRPRLKENIKRSRVNKVEPEATDPTIVLSSDEEAREEQGGVDDKRQLAGIHSTILPSTELKIFKVQSQMSLISAQSGAFEDESFSCPICFQSQISSAKTYRHLVLEHSENKLLFEAWIVNQLVRSGAVASGGSDVLVVKCTVCRKSAKSREALRHHLRSHIINGDVGDEDFLEIRNVKAHSERSSEQLKKSQLRKGRLKEWIDRKINERKMKRGYSGRTKVWPCCICQKVTKSSGTLRYHFKMHSRNGEIDLDL